MLSPRSIEAFNKVNEVVTKSFNVTVEQLCSKVRTAQVVDAKFVAWWVLHKRYRRAFVIIADLYRKDHTTIISAIRKLERGQGQRIIALASKIEKILDEQEKISGIQV